jgi:ArsR family transcriptional regulator
MSKDAATVIERLRAVGEPTRLRILALLAEEELAVLELGQILDQSQPRVSRHLKLLTESGLAERFPDGAWVFYRLSTQPDGVEAARTLLGLVDHDDPVLVRDRERLDKVRAERRADAQSYFARNASQWERLRTLYVSEADVERAIVEIIGARRFRRLVDLGAGTGRMLTLLGPLADEALGLDLSQQMLNIARSNLSEASLPKVEVRHGDIFNTGLADGYADLVVVHQVLHYLSEPAAAVAEAARIVAPGGKLVVVDFAPHGMESLRQAHQHRRLGFSTEDMQRWIEAGGLRLVDQRALPPADGQGLTVMIWSAERPTIA